MGKDDLAPQCQGERYSLDILVGADNYWKFVDDKIVRGNSPEIVCVGTKFGYIPSGPCTFPQTGQKSASVNVSNVTVVENPMDRGTENSLDISRYWDVESLGITNDLDSEPAHTFDLDNYCSKHIRLINGRYEVDLPWNNQRQFLPTNYRSCAKQTRGMVHKLDEEKRLSYDKIISEQLHRGFIERVLNPEPSKGHYLCHYAIEKDSTTTPLRIVYRCNFRIGESPSLNDCLHVGTPLLQDLGGIIMRSRLFPNLASAGIEKAFLNVTIATPDRPFTKFLWLQDPEDPSSTFVEYQFRSVLFGASCSPFILNAVIHTLLNSHQSNITELLRGDIYVDNVISSVPDAKVLQQFYNESNDIFQSAGFRLRSWTTNNALIQKQATADNRSAPAADEVNLLGMTWHKNTDTMTCKPLPSVDHSVTITSNAVLRETARLYDVPGFLLPVHVKAKLLLQDLQAARVTKKQPIPQNFAMRWKVVHDDLRKASAVIHWPRIALRDITPVTPVELHAFADASKRSYGTAVYLVTADQSTLFWAKNKLVHSSEQANPRIPRFELNSCVLAANVLDYITKNIGHRIKIVRRVLWSDSQIALWWINSEKSRDRYVENRRKVIKSVDIQETRYCPTGQNPADLLTRGIQTEELKNSTLWWKGPEWLITKAYPTWDGSPSVRDVNMNLVVTKTLPTIHEVNEGQTEDAAANKCPMPDVARLIDEERISSLRKLVKVSVFVLRFIRNAKQRSLQTRTVNLSRPPDPLTVREINEVKRLWFIKEQARHFADEKRSLQAASVKTKTCLARQLKLFLHRGVIHKGSRLRNAPIDDQTKYPVLLHKNSHFTKLVIRDAHSRMLHSGCAGTTNAIKQSYYIPNVVYTVKRVLRECTTCNRINSRAFKMPATPSLPKFRVDASVPAFHATGIDYTGEVHVKNLDGTAARVYIVLFTCATTRAIHLDYVQNMSTVQFLSCFQRFTARKSTPRIIVSDNASYFQSASNELSKMLKDRKVREFFAEQNIKWTFIPKRAPWYGAFWERMIGVMKRTLQKTVGKKLLTELELYTILAQIEAATNDRPLTAVTSDADGETITPSHLLYGRKMTALPLYDPEEDDEYKPEPVTKDSAIKRLRHMERLYEHYWSMFKTDYLPALRDRHNLPEHLSSVNREVKQGDIVLVHDEIIKRPLWKVARILKILPSTDGLQRAAEIRTKNGTTNRPLSKLYPLELCFRENREELNSETNAQIQTNQDIDAQIIEGYQNDEPRPRRRAAVEALKKIKKQTDILERS